MNTQNQLESFQNFLERQKATFVKTCEDIFGLNCEYKLSEQKELTKEEIAQLPPQFVLVQMQYSGLLAGNQFLLLSENDAKTVYAVIMGIEDVSGIKEEELGDGLANFFHQTYGELCNQLADELDEDIQMEFPTVEVEGKSSMLPQNGFAANVDITGLSDSPISFLSLYSEELIESYVNLNSSSSESETQSVSDTDAEKEVPAEEIITAHSVEFQPLPENANGKGNGDITLDLLMNIELPITVELGRTEMYIKDVLGLHKGSIIELNKLSGDPVDLYVNNRKFAEGEVVIIDENFGVRITQLLNTAERLDQIKEK